MTAGQGVGHTTQAPGAPGPREARAEAGGATRARRAHRTA